MAREKRRDGGRHVVRAEGHRRGEPDGAARFNGFLRYRTLGFIEFSEDLHAAFVKCAPGFGQAEPSGGALEQSRLQVGFQLRHLAGYRCGRQSEAFRRSDKASGFNDLHKGL
jgi:hypothetical protein